MDTSNASSDVPAPSTPRAPLLTTKLHAPRRRGVLARPRLRARLDPHDLPALTLVSAAAGFGKTTLVAESFAGAPGAAWLSLDARDDDPEVFWTYVVAALRTTTPAAGAAASSLLEAPQPSIDAVVATLLNDLHAVGGETVLILDDYHVIESPEIHDGVTYLIDHLPPHVHLVITTRVDPPLPLAAMRARGELVEVRAADLRFTDDEAATYLRDSMGIDLAPADVALLEARTEGWIAALQLAALSMQGRDDVAGFVAEFAGDDRFILDYLVGEVLDRQEPEIRRFLVETSILGRHSGPLCDAVTGRTDGRATLERLERSNLFVVPLDDRRTWYRYHHLFADVLRARLLDEDAGALPELHRRASDWFEAQGERGEAIGHAIAGGHLERAAELIELAAPLLQQQRREVTLRRWLEALPDGVFDDRPVLAITLVGARMATGDPTGVDALLRVVEASLDAPTQPIVADHDMFARLPTQLSIYRAALALLTGDLDAATTHGSRALELAGPDDHLGRGSATALIGLARWASGDLPEAERCYAAAITSLTAADRLPDVLGCSLGLADMQVARGGLGDALRTLDEGLRLATQQPGLRGAADMHVGLADVLIERDELASAADHLEASAELGDHAGLPQNPYRHRVALSRLRFAVGDPDAALALLDEAAPLYDTDFSPPVRPVDALRARVHLALGDIDAANDWATRVGVDARDEPSYVREFEHLTLARLLLARHSVEPEGTWLEDAATLLDRLRAAAEDGDRNGSAVEVLVLQAAVHLARGDAPSATTSVQEALRRAEGERYVRVFLDAGPAVRELVRSLASGDGVTAHARRVIAAANESSARTPAAAAPVSPSELVDPLSARELEALRLLASELSGPEIARELLVSLNTFRSHTKSIYAKLGVNSRRAAVRRAAELGL